ncbi:hypothetical protein B0T24DRAFT_624037 [Lasiosphaeria ovina]|uniref:Secreted protein n=1 Tax=Lasiosphaeria ovina TaxID=92902 RepID=A0AAE0KBD7_9PEZI|nr:hypothetical protein B0T24DRAFT_624037 [Lasiosphaeria ovina]
MFFFSYYLFFFGISSRAPLQPDLARGTSSPLPFEKRCEAGDYNTVRQHTLSNANFALVPEKYPLNLRQPNENPS